MRTRASGRACAPPSIRNGRSSWSCRFRRAADADTNARYVARKLEEKLGKPVVVENRPGGNSFIAAQAVVSAEPDGYTLLLASNSPVATNVAMFRKLPYDPVHDLAPIARLRRGRHGAGGACLIVLP
ncbi:Bug family tripartite tricarboxylate transporter substrate binding protein [Cupriavidus basilensis]